MKTDPPALARVTGIVVATVLLQVSGVGSIELLGGNFDLIPIAIAAIAYCAGSVPGAVTGFAAGILLDLMIGREVGASALPLIALGYFVGRYRELRDPAHGLTPVAVVAASTAIYLVAVAAVAFMLGLDASISLLVVRDLILTVFLNSLLALPLFWLIGRTLRPSLHVDPFVRRRRRGRPIESGPIGLRGLEV